MNTSICAIIKDELLYLQEWIEWHLKLGFDAIYLYEDTGSSSHKEITDKYSNVFLSSIDDIDEVDFINQLEIAYKQVALYDWFIRTFKDKYDWVAFIDIDEYFFFDDGYDLNKLCDEFTDYSAIAINWRMMGANGHIKRPESIVKSYTKPCLDLHIDTGWEYKSFVNLHKCTKMITHHLAEDAVNVNEELITDTTKYTINHSKVCLNHYFTKSWEDWCLRIFKRGDLCNGHRTAEQFFICNTDMLPLKDKLMKSILSIQPINSFWIDRTNHLIAGGNINQIEEINKMLSKQSKNKTY